MCKDVWRRAITQDSTTSAKYWTAGSVLQRHREGKDPCLHSSYVSFTSYIALYTVVLSFRSHIGLSFCRWIVCFKHLHFRFWSGIENMLVQCLLNVFMNNTCSTFNFACLHSENSTSYTVCMLVFLVKVWEFPWFQCHLYYWTR